MLHGPRRSLSRRHFDSTVPNSREAIARNFAGVPEDEQALILGENMVRVYNLQDALA